MILIPKRVMRDPISMLPLFDRYARESMGDPGSESPSRTLPMDIVEQDDSYIIMANLPGFDKRDVQLTTRKDHLVIEAKHSEQEAEEELKLRYSERFSGGYSRAVHLPETIDRENIKAAMVDGVLTITIPKHNHANKEIVVE